jgi:hypothetical protein
MAEELKISIPQEANSHFSGGPPEWLASIVTEGQIKTGNSQMHASATDSKGSTFASTDSIKPEML